MNRVMKPIGACAFCVLLGGAMRAQTPSPHPAAAPAPAPAPAADVIEDVSANVHPVIDTHIDVDAVNRINSQVRAAIDRLAPVAALNMPILISPRWQGSFDSDQAEGSYRAGTRAIDRRDYEKAVASMDRVIAGKSSRADGAYYWKAYAQSKLGRTQDALATLAALQRNYPKSAWLNDAKALEVETRQDAGQKVRPDSEANDDLKLLAINGLMHSDPAQATPLVERVLNDPKNAPAVRERALFVLARSNAPAARETVMRFAEGNANPDLQMRAIQYLAATEGKGDSAVFTKIYKQATDAAVKRSALQAMMMLRDQNALLTVAKSEPNLDLRRQAIRFLGGLDANEALSNLYRSESDAEVKRTILDALASHDDGKDLVAIARSENDPKLKREAVERLSTMNSKVARDYMLEILGK